MLRHAGWVIAKHLVIAAVAFWVFLTILFIFLAAQPGGLAQVYLSSPRSSPEARAALAHRLGLDAPVPLQYLNYLKNAVTGNLGVSFNDYPRPVWNLVQERLPRSLFLFTLALLLAIPLGTGLSHLFTKRRWAGASRLISLGVVSLFLPWLALALIALFSVTLGWLPVGKLYDPLLWIQYLRNNTLINFNSLFGLITLSLAIGLMAAVALYTGELRALGPRTRPRGVVIGIIALSVIVFVGVFTGSLRLLVGDSTHWALALDLIRHMVLPLGTLTLMMTALYALIVRSDLFRSRPLDGRSFVPFFGFFLASSFAALLIVEVIYSWPGIGLTLLQAVLDKDSPLAIGAVLAIVTSLIVFKFGMAIRCGLVQPASAAGATEGMEQLEPQKKAFGLFYFADGLLLVFVVLALAHPLLMHTVWNPSIYDPVVGNDPSITTKMINGGVYPGNPAPPSGAHWLGTDANGRDVFSQLAYSAQPAFSFGGLAGLIAVLLGLGAAGLVQLLERRRAQLVGRGLLACGSAVLALPLVPLLIFALGMASLNLGLYTFALVIGLFSGPLVLFILRDRGEPMRPADWKSLAQTLAAGFFYVMAIATMAEAVLSFFLAVNIPMSWGTMLAWTEIVGYLSPSGIAQAPWLFFSANLAIWLFGLSSYLLGWEFHRGAWQTAGGDVPAMEPSPSVVPHGAPPTPELEGET